MIKTKDLVHMVVFLFVMSIFAVWFLSPSIIMGQDQADPVTVTANIGDDISCSVNATSTAFGELAVDEIKTSTPEITVTLSCPNVPGGCLVNVEGVGSSTSPGLWNSSVGHLIASTDTTLSAGTEGYGINATTSDALTIDTKYDKSGNAVGGLSLTGVLLASSAAEITDADVLVSHKAAISVGTPAGNYQDTITYSCTGN